MRRIAIYLNRHPTGRAKSQKQQVSFPFLRMNNITRTGEIDFADLKFMDLEANEHDRYLVRTR